MKKRLQTHISTGFTAQIKKLPKSKKRYHLVSFWHQTCAWYISKQWINHSEKTQSHVTFRIMSIF